MKNVLNDHQHPIIPSRDSTGVCSQVALLVAGFRIKTDVSSYVLPTFPVSRTYGTTRHLINSLRLSLTVCNDIEGGEEVDVAYNCNHGAYVCQDEEMYQDTPFLPLCLGEKVFWERMNARRDEFQFRSNSSFQQRAI
ncbi:hypothetical protein TNCV_4408211 [Trichonephila clavipes]|nr:hypothetical protein TNCV_4408211 [Trichonephila clavipes]